MKANRNTNKRKKNVPFPLKTDALFPLKLLVVQGPNLNLLGERNPGIYGQLTLKKIHQNLREYAKKKKIKIRFFQSNSEGALIDFLHKHRKWADGLVINPGAFTHYSYALRDAIEAIELPTYEVHLSDIFNREPFRATSVILPVCTGQIHGLGWMSYLKAIEKLEELLLNKRSS